MSGDVTLCFYIVIGMGVAVAVWVRDRSDDHLRRVFCASTAVVFWPMYLPLLLAANRTVAGDPGGLAKGDSSVAHHSDELDFAISQAEADLDRALLSLDHWPDVAAFVEADRFVDLRVAWSRKADEIRELDQLLATSEIQVTVPYPETKTLTENADRIVSSEHARLDHLAELRVVRQQRHDDLLASLAQVRQLVTMIHLARYTGKPASQAVEIIQQIAGTALSNDEKRL